MKTLLTMATLSMSFNIFALERSVTLDFSNLYGNTNAGIYEMKVNFIPKTTKSESTLDFHISNDDGYYSCTTSANFEIGKESLTLTNKNNGEVQKFETIIFGSVSSVVDGEDCDTSIDKLKGTQGLYSRVGFNKPFLLNVKAPFDYQAVGVYLEPFNGYLNIEADLSISGNKLVLDPSNLLTERSVMPLNDYNSSVTYYVYATKDTTTLSLGTGLIKFEK